MSNKRIYVGLLHYPIYNKRMDIVTTSVTGLDIHDIARSSRTYDVKKYYIIHPVETQKALVQDILDYWTEGFGGSYNPDRKEAFSRLELVTDLEATIKAIEEIEGQRPKVITTDARIYPNTVTYKFLREEVTTEEECYLLLFGTGWGMEQSIMTGADHILEPIYGPCDYNHLSVRSAVAIILDRLLGEAWWEK
jgi:hypothetical protein